METNKDLTTAKADNVKNKIVLSGIRATGNLHIGNYYGALQKFINMQNDNFDCRFFIADLHALTTHPDPKTLHQNVKQIIAEYLAAGLDPEKVILYVQSDIPEISEMYTLMNMHVGIGELMRTASFKDKARKALGISVDKADNEEIEKEIIGNQTNRRVNAGLLTYPTLMAVDILIHHADYVPVGKDQEQHLELTRRFARRFNSFYGVDYFHEPVNFNLGDHAIKVPGLDGSGKMGKSEGNCIFLIDDEKTLRKKVMRAVTDEGPKEPNSKPTQPVENLFTLMEIVSKPEIVTQFRDAYADCSIRYGDMKKQLAEDILSVTLPIRERILEIQNNDKYISEVVEHGAEKARVYTSSTLKDVREIMGIRKF